MVTVEALFLTALLSAYMGLIALFALTAPRPRGSGDHNFLMNLVMLAAIVSLASFLLYAVSPHSAARAIYGASVAVSPNA